MFILLHQSFIKRDKLSQALNKRKAKKKKKSLLGFQKLSKYSSLNHFLLSAKEIKMIREKVGKSKQIFCDCKERQERVIPSHPPPSPHEVVHGGEGGSGRQRVESGRDILIIIIIIIPLSCVDLRRIIVGDKSLPIRI